MNSLGDNNHTTLKNFHTRQASRSTNSFPLSKTAFFSFLNLARIIRRRKYFHFSPDTVWLLLHLPVINLPCNLLYQLSLLSKYSMVRKKLSQTTGIDPSANYCIISTITFFLLLMCFCLHNGADRLLQFYLFADYLTHVGLCNASAPKRCFSHSRSLSQQLRPGNQLVIWQLLQLILSLDHLTNLIFRFQHF